MFGTHMVFRGIILVVYRESCLCPGWFTHNLFVHKGFERICNALRNLQTATKLWFLEESLNRVDTGYCTVIMPDRKTDMQIYDVIVHTDYTILYYCKMNDRLCLASLTNHV